MKNNPGMKYRKALRTWKLLTADEKARVKAKVAAKLGRPPKDVPEIWNNLTMTERMALRGRAAKNRRQARRDVMGFVDDAEIGKIKLKKPKLKSPKIKLPGKKKKAAPKKAAAPAAAPGLPGFPSLPTAPGTFKIPPLFPGGKPAGWRTVAHRGVVKLNPLPDDWDAKKAMYQAAGYEVKEEKKGFLGTGGKDLRVRWTRQPFPAPLG